MAERTESPTGDPLISEAERAEEESRAQRAANLFDLRRIIGGLFMVYGAILTVVGLTDKKEDPFSVADGWEPVRNRFGISYEDDCLNLGLTWRRDYELLGDFRKGSTIALQIGLKGLGR